MAPVLGLSSCRPWNLTQHIRTKPVIVRTQNILYIKSYIDSNAALPATMRNLSVLSIKTNRANTNACPVPMILKYTITQGLALKSPARSVCGCSLHSSDDMFYQARKSWLGLISQCKPNLQYWEINMTPWNSHGNDNKKKQNKRRRVSGWTPLIFT